MDTIPVSRPTSYLLYEINDTCQLRPRFAWIFTTMQYYFPSHWAMQILIYLFNKVLILRLFSLWAKQIPICDPKRSMLSALQFLMFWCMKMLVLKLKCFSCLPGRWRFLAILVPDTGRVMLTSCINDQPVMLHSPGTWTETLLWMYLIIR